MKNYISDLYWTLYTKRDEWQKKRAVKRYKKKYPDYIDNEYNMGSLKFIWGVISGDNLSSAKTANIYTMNDIDIIYDRDTKLYSLGVETAYCFENKNQECRYFRQLLNAFTKYMTDNNFKDCKYNFFCSDCDINSDTETIEELYTKFKIFVEGYCKVFQTD